MDVRRYIIPVFVPHLGCPHDCVFCNQRKITGLENETSLLDVEVMIDSYLEEISKNINEKYVEIAFYGGSFTGIDDILQESYLKIAYKKVKSGLVGGIRLSTRPDYINEEILDRLKKYGVKTIELGVQSLDKKVLIKSNRGHTIADVVNACKLIRDYKFNLGLQMMIGLPGDMGQSSELTAEKIINLNPDFVRIYPTLVVKDTDLEVMVNNCEYKPLSIEDAVDVTTAVYKKFIKAKIDVIRIGLQPTDDLSNGTNLIAGPYHPSFRQLVEGKLYSDIMSNVLSEFESIESIIIEINSKEISNIVGLNRVNLNYFENLYKLKKISVFPIEIKRDTFNMIVNGKKIKVKK